MKKTIIITLALSALGCESHALAIEDEFTAREVELVELAIDEWVTATDSDEARVFTSDGYHSPGVFSYWSDWFAGPDDFAVLHKIQSSSQGYKDLKSLIGNGFDGAADTGRRIAIVENHIEDEDHFFAVILHELGHFYGLSHADKGIMTSSNELWCIDRYTLQTFCDMHDCGANARQTCGGD